MKRFAGPAIAVILIALIAASLIWLKDYTPFGRSAGPGEMSNIGLRLDGAELVGWSHGRPNWKFKARVVEVSSNRVYTTFTDITHGAIYNNGQPALTLSGRRVVYNTFTHDLDAFGGIKADAGHKVSISTSRLKWNAYLQKLTCPEYATICTAAGKGHAKSLTADLKNQQLELVDVSMRIRVEEEMLR